MTDVQNEIFSFYKYIIHPQKPIMLDTEQAIAKIKQLEDYIDGMTRRHGEELQKIDAQYLEHIVRLEKDNRDQIEMIENLQTELNQLKNQ